MTWLRDVPVAVVTACGAMLDRLQAEEEMAAATCGAVARGTKVGPWIKRQWSLWSRAARGRARAVKAKAVDLQALGIGRKVVKRVGEA